MRPPSNPPGRPVLPAESLRLLEERLRSSEVLRRVQDRLGPSATLDDARLAYRRTKQESRRPCSFLDAAYGIDRRRTGGFGA